MKRTKDRNEESRLDKSRLLVVGYEKRGVGYIDPRRM